MYQLTNKPGNVVIKAKAERVKVGDVVQIQPFTFPVTAEFVDATVKVILKDKDLGLVYIGQISTPTMAEGKASISVFFYAVEKCDMLVVNFKLVNKKNKEIDEKYRVTYKIQVKE